MQIDKPIRELNREMVTEAQIGELMREIRKEKGFTSIEIANRLNISQPKLSRIETGTQPVTISLLSRFCDLCGISLSEFFRILEDKISFQTHIKENPRDYCGEIPSIYRLFTDLTREEKEAIIVLIQAFKKNG